LKGIKLKAKLTILILLALGAAAGCGLNSGLKKTGKGRVFLTVDFKENQTLRYKFTSGRNITIELSAAENGIRPNKRTFDKFSESLEMVIAYSPLEINPYGLSTIKATCKSIKAKRSTSSRRDAVENLAGKSYTFTVGPTGKVEDYSQLDKLLKKVGEKAFRTDTKTGRIKEPDMICDFVASQWFLWDSISSIKEPSKGVRIGQSWKSKLSVPGPMVMRKARDVTYTLEEIRESEKGRLAVISSTYDKAESVPNSWPIPYSGRFQMSGPFGFYRNYKILSLHGEGEEIFNIDAGRIDKSVQHYIMNMSASLLMPLPGVNPRITIKQYLTMELLGH
jgi:hypothetical protein